MRKYLLLLLLALCSIQIKAQKQINRPDSYNYNRGIEAWNKQDYEEAAEYFRKELEEHPENGYAYTWVAYLDLNRMEYGQALTAANTAIKKLPSKDKEYVAITYVCRAQIYLCLEDTLRAIKDLTQAINARPDEPDMYKQRAQIYFEQGEYALSDADYSRMIALDEGNVMGYMGIGRNAKMQEKWDDAIKQFDYVIKLAPDYSSGYSFRAESLIGLKKYDDAIDDIITAINLDHNQKAFYLMKDIVGPAKAQLIAKLKVQTTKNPNDYIWPYCLGIIFEETGAYRKAIEYYTYAHEKEPSDVTANRISICYRQIGDYESAIEYMDYAIALDSTYYSYIIGKANLLYETGNVRAAINEANTCVALAPEYYWGYYRRGWYKHNSGDVEGAIDDYSMSIVLEPSYAYAYLGRGEMYELNGDMASAMADYKKVIQIDTVPENNSCAQYAYWFLGRKNEAIDFMNRVISSDPEDAGNYYDAACLYSLMGELEKALEYMRTALEKGYRRFAHIEVDDDLNSIRQLPEFIDMIQYYKSQFIREIKDGAADVAYEDQTIEIPFTKEEGVLKIKCSINDVPLYFVFDTGASDVSISSVEASFMMKNGYLKSTDVIGKQNYMMASGEINEGTIINIRNVNFGGLNLNNVRASVIQNQKAPLLLGQSVLNRLGTIEIDNKNKILKVTYKKKIER